MPTDPSVSPLSIAARPELTGTPSQTVGVLLSHGFTGSPASMRPWGEFLGQLGYAVEIPLLPGHGTSWQDMNTTRWEDWYAEVGRALDKLLAENDKVVIGGLSMGGALVLRLAADRPEDVAGVMLVNAAVASTNKQLLAVPLLKRVVSSVPAIGGDIKKPGATEHAYDRTPLHALASMTHAWKALRKDLPKVTAPVRIFRSAEDHVVDPSSARLIKASVSSREVSETILENSYHVATIDNDAETIFEESREFIASVTEPT
ncbi:MAG: alpha/beta fold hydrolase [Nocardioides sp.]|nr:alpha/beta fold hydrolase [Nocardioides sp.]